MSILCNLWHIRQTNGLYYYSLDYLRAIGAPVLVLVRPALYEAASRALPGHQVRAVSAFGFVAAMAGALLRRRWVFTPTSHPFPLLRRQLIVIHDDYPFLGPRGPFKRRVFRLLLCLSRCHVGHINYSTALGAIPGDLVSEARRWYMPNLGPLTADIDALRQARLACATPGQDAPRPVMVALFGTDSRKKRYEMLFAAIRAAGLEQRFAFAAYGHESDYYRELKAAFPKFPMELVHSSSTGMEAFLREVDVIVSVANNEGFGRPIALALAAGIPCFLLHSEVFEEFFGRSTRLYRTVAELVAAMAAAAPDCAQAGSFKELEQIRTSFSIAVARLGRLTAGEELHP